MYMDVYNVLNYWLFSYLIFLFSAILDVAYLYQYIPRIINLTFKINYEILE